MTQNPDSPGGSDRGGGGRIALIFGLVLVVAVAAAAIVTSIRPPVEFPRDTPEGTLQTFYRSLDAGDFDGAHAVLDDRLQRRCAPSELASGVSGGTIDKPTRLAVDRVTPAGTETIVVVRATYLDSSDPFQPYTYEQNLEFVLRNDTTPPLISELPWPFSC
ncbi:MAG: hypothetical protein ACT4OP_12615 [Actinomycetota bacterium]